MESSLYILIIFSIAYTLVNALLWKGLRLLRYSQANTEKQNLSVIIAARNESVNIKRCIESLTAQNYPTDKFEIIVANDRSTDNTKEIVSELAKIHSNVRLLNIEKISSDMPSKKFALSQAIAISSFDILVFTDADCFAEKNWLQEVSNNFTSEVGAVAGYSPNDFSELHNYFGKTFLRYEELKNSIGAAAGITLRNAFMCTGRNFAYRKSLFHQVGGFEKIKHSISGDDDLFIQLLQKETHCTMRYMTSAESFVTTTPPLSFQKFITQRIRHISASKYYPLKIKLLYAVIHLCNIISLTALFFIPLYGLVYFLLKINIDAVTLVKSEKYFKEKFSLIEFVLGELFFVLYNIIIGPLGYILNFSWKGEQKN